MQINNLIIVQLISELYLIKNEHSDNIRKCWSTCTTYEEVKTLKKIKWNKRNGKDHVVTWNIINMSMSDPGDGSIQRIVYISYYTENVARGGTMI